MVDFAFIEADLRLHAKTLPVRIVKLYELFDDHGDSGLFLY